MHVVLPELDGRVLAGAVAFKDPLPPHEGLAFTALANRPEPDRIAMVADRIAALVRLRTMPRGERRDRGADAGLSRRARAHRLCGRARRAGERDRAARRSRRRRLRGARRAADAAHLLDALAAGADEATLTHRANTKPCWRACRLPRSRGCAMPGASRRTIPTCATARFRFRAQTFGNVLVALPPDRGRAAERRADYHDPPLPPRHALRRLRPVAAARGQGRCARPHGRARHARMAARQGGRADSGMLSRKSWPARCR